MTVKVSADRELEKAARHVRKNAHAPYSRFKVGAAVRAASGRIYLGVNVENASFGLTVCAERNAIAAAITAGEKKIRAIAIATATGAAPCGACRQVLSEFAPALPIALVAPAKPVRYFTLNELLPEQFTEF
jgi:cytidine deaminase